MFSSIPLEFITVVACADSEVDIFTVRTDHFASKMALSWAKGVPTLKHVVVVTELSDEFLLPDCEEFRFEAVRSVDGITTIRPIPLTKLDGICEIYDRWS